MKTKDYFILLVLTAMWFFNASVIANATSPEHGIMFLLSILVTIKLMEIKK